MSSKICSSIDGSGVTLANVSARYGYFMASFLAFFYSHQWEQQHCGSQIAFFAGGPSHAILFRTIVMGVVISTRQLQLELQKKEGRREKEGLIGNSRDSCALQLTNEH